MVGLCIGQFVEWKWSSVEVEVGMHEMTAGGKKRKRARKLVFIG